MRLGDWLDRAGYTTVLQATDFVADSNFYAGELADRLRRAFLFCQYRVTTSTALASHCSSKHLAAMLFFENYFTPFG